VISTTIADSVKLTFDMFNRNGLACWTEGAGENNPRIIDAIETAFTTMIPAPSLVAVRRHLRIRG
jgi:hypothetical protein